MKRVTHIIAALSIFATGAIIAWYAADDTVQPEAFAATNCSTGLIRTNNAGNSPLSIPCIPNTPCWRQGSNTYRPADVTFAACTPAAATTTAAPTTTRPPTTTLAPTTTSTTIPTTSTSTTTPTTTTTATTTTTVPGSAQFVETFDNNAGLSRFDYGVYHRNLGFYRPDTYPPDGRWGDGNALHGGDWTGDHDLNCGNPDTQRQFIEDADAPEVADLAYTCVNHMMTSMGEVDGFSIVFFSPNQVFGSVNSISFDVNLTDLGDRKWWKVGVVSDALYHTLKPQGSCADAGTSWCPDYHGRAPGFIVSDVGSADTWTNSLNTPQLFYATWSGGASAGYPGGMKIGDALTGRSSNPTPTDKMTRHPVSLVDNHNGTVTFTVAGVSATASGAFPACPCRVVFLDQNYTPLKDGPIRGTTWHWDSIVVR